MELRFSFIFALSLFLKIFLVLSAEEAVGYDSRFLLTSNVTSGVIHSAGYCAMYGLCGARSDGKPLNCPYNRPAVKPDELFSSKIQSLCPTLTGNVCCTEAQFEILRSQVQQAVTFLVGCPACLRNFLNLMCELGCSPDQSLFINVTSIKKSGNNLTVDGIDFFVNDAFGEGLYNSCKDVKYGAMNSLAIDYVGAGAQNFTAWFAFLGKRAPPMVPGSPFAISFRGSVPESSGMIPMNDTTYSCGDVSLGCSCGDCPSSATCSGSVGPPQKEGSCKIRIGALKAKCIDVAVAIAYIIIVSVFLGWGFSHRKKEIRKISGTKPSVKVASSQERDAENQKDENLPYPIPEGSTGTPGVKLSAVQGYMSNFYRNYGSWVAKRPSLVLFPSIVIALLLCLGLLHFKVETRPEKLWVAPGSRAQKEKQFFDSHLAPFYRIEQLILATMPDEAGKSQSILNEDNVKLLFQIQKKVDGIRARYTGSTVSLTDICMKPLGQDCATQSVLQYYKMDPENFEENGVDHAVYCYQHFSSDVECLSAFKGPLDPSTALGGYSGNNYSEASSFVVTYPVNNAVDRESDEAKKAVAWERAFIDLAQNELLPMVQSRNLTLAFSSESSIEDELKRESTADAITIVISYLVMFAYISLTLGDRPRLSSFYLLSKVLLGLSGVVLVMLSVLGSVGFFSAIGVKSTLIIMEVIPFLVLAVGVDNMCILVHAVKRQELELPLEVRIGNALSEVGPSITLASLSEVLAFAVGSIIPMPAIRVFSMFAALAVLLDFLLQVTAFVALIVFDILRVEDNRIDCFPCIKIPSSANGEHGIGQKKDMKDGILARYMKEIQAPVLSLWGVKIIVISVFTALTLASIALCTRIEPGLEQQLVLPRDSYLQGYFNNITEYLRIGPPLYFVVKNYNYSSESRQTNQLCSISQCDSNSLLTEISKASLIPESSYIAKPAASWLDDFLVWLSPEAFGCCRKFTNGSFCPPADQPPCCAPGQTLCSLDGLCKDCTTCFLHLDLINDRPSTLQFREKLPWFLNALPSADCSKGGHGAYTHSVDLQGYENGVIQASEFRTYHTPLNKQVDYVNSMKAAYKFASKVSESLQMEIFPYSVFYVFFEQYLDIWKTALITLAVAIGMVFLVCWGITCSLWSSLITLLVLAMILIDLMGVMAILNIQLNAISVVNLVMSVGIAVEFCVHITHAFLTNAGDKNQRMKAALGTMGASVFSGITMTKLVGVIVLRFSRSKVFVVYYFQMYLALVLLGFLHGLVFLPVVLSLFGPPSRCIENQGEQQKPSSSTST
ncbi:hypothetical protein Droror1_Dr00023674 [Drosera rotundifolia]